MQQSTRFSPRHILIAAILVAALAIAACSSAPAAAPQAEAPAAIAMAAAPQLLAPQAYQDQFAASGAPFQLIDVRTPEEFESGHIAGAVNIPVDQLGQRLAEVSQGQPVVVYCRSGNRSHQAAQILEQAGYTGIYDLGGVIAWQQAGFPLE